MRRIQDFLCLGVAGALLACQAPSAAGGQIPTRPAAGAPRPQTATTAAGRGTPGESFAALQRRLAAALRGGDTEEVAELAERQSKLYPAEMKATADLADVCLARGEMERAERLLRAALTQRNLEYGGDGAALLGSVHASLGRIALGRGRTKEAIAHLQRSVDYAPTAARARFMLATAFSRVGDVERSDRELRAAFDVDASAAGPVDYVLLGGSLERAGNVDGAIDALATAVTRFPFDVDVRIARSDALRAGGRAAAALYELLYAQMLMHDGAPQAAAVAERVDGLRATAEAAAGEPDPELESVFAYLHDASTDQHDQALQSIHEAIRLGGGRHLVPRLLLAESYIATGRLGEAERLLTQLIEQEPMSVPAMATLAGLYFSQQRPRMARRVLDRAARLDANNPRLREVVDAWKE